jgi:hypothetical protein
MGQGQRGGDDVAYPAWADGGVMQRLPVADQDGEAAFALPAQAAQELVVGTVVGCKRFAVGGLLDRGLTPCPALS